MGNQMFKALEKAGFINKKSQKTKKKWHGKKPVKCRRCNSEMEQVDNSNIFICSNSKCNNFYVRYNKN